LVPCAPILKFSGFTPRIWPDLKILVVQAHSSCMEVAVLAAVCLLRHAALYLFRIILFSNFVGFNMLLSSFLDVLTIIV